MNVEHKTIRIEKMIKSPISKVYRALSDTKQKVKWSAPKGDEIKFFKSSFKIGGVETFECGSVGSRDFKGIIHYEEIIKNQRIVYTETVSLKKEKLSSALITTELLEKDGQTTVRMVIQVASYCGERMLRGCETGYKHSLNNLKEYLEN